MNNFLIGKKAGINITTGEHNICIGDDSGIDITNESYCLRIGDSYRNKMTPRQFDMLYAALRWIVQGDRSMIGDDHIGTGNSSTQLGSLNKWIKV